LAVSTSGQGHLGPQGPAAVAALVSGDAFAPHTRCDGHGYFSGEGPSKPCGSNPRTPCPTLISGMRRGRLWMPGIVLPLGYCRE